MVRSFTGLIVSCALLSTGAFAGEKNIGSMEDPGGKVKVAARGVALSVGSLEDTITSAIHVRDFQVERSLTVMSPVNGIRFSLQGRNGSTDVMLVDAKTNAVTQRWTVDSATSASAISEISGTVLTAMGLSSGNDIANGVPDGKSKPAHK